MTLDEKVRKTLAELAVLSGAHVSELFHEVLLVAEGESAQFYGPNRPGPNDVNRVSKALRDRWLARNGGIVSLIDQNWLKPAPEDLKPAVGAEFNALRELIAAMLGTEALLKSWKNTAGELAAALPRQAAKPTAPPDLTLPGYRRALGSIHPVTRVLREIEDIFINLGFRIETGPEIESVHYNFDALNIPETHPARDDWDTLYVDERTVLRTHTSPVQIRAMEQYGAPLYVIAPGKVYRHDNPDASHATMFHQVEGLAVDRDITFADLKGTLDFFVKKFFGERVRTRFQPSFFPFTEPSAEMAVSCWACEGAGCGVCKQSGWVEIMGCGMVHPEVLKHGGIDPKKFSGWAFGFGVDRMAMIKFGITDIQLFCQSDLRFLEQF